MRSCSSVTARKSTVSICRSPRASKPSPRAQRRAKVLGAFRLQADAEGTQRLLGCYPEDQATRLRTLWQKLGAMASQCQQINERNGKLLATSRNPRPAAGRQPRCAAVPAADVPKRGCDLRSLRRPCPSPWLSVSIFRNSLPRSECLARQTPLSAIPRAFSRCALSPAPCPSPLTGEIPPSVRRKRHFPFLRRSRCGKRFFCGHQNKTLVNQ